MMHLRDTHGTFKPLTLLARVAFSKRAAYHTTIPTTICESVQLMNGFCVLQVRRINKFAFKVGVKKAIS